MLGNRSVQFSPSPVSLFPNSPPIPSGGFTVNPYPRIVQLFASKQGERTDVSLIIGSFVAAAPGSLGFPLLDARFLYLIDSQKCGVELLEFWHEWRVERRFQLFQTLLLGVNNFFVKRDSVIMLVITAFSVEYHLSSWFLARVVFYIVLYVKWSLFRNLFTGQTKACYITDDMYVTKQWYFNKPLCNLYVIFGNRHSTLSVYD